MQAILGKLAARVDLSAAEAESAMRVIMSGEASPALIGSFLTGLRCKGETVEELLGCACAMRAFALPVRSRHALLVDTCGTGGDGAGTFNISTTAAIVVAAAGVPVAKHGNRAASSRCGSADVLEALGVRVDLTPAEVGACLDELGIGFLFAQTHHPAMRHVGPARRELGFRTVFNLLGPLCNPAGAQVQLVGVPEEGLLAPLAEVLLRLGTRRALLVHGADGLDELTLGGPTRVVEAVAGGGSPVVAEVTPESAGLAGAPLGALRGGSAQENAAITLAVLAGEAGPRQDVVCLNAGAALLAAGAASDLAAGVARAREAIRGGAALRLLEAWRRHTAGCRGASA